MRNGKIHFVTVLSEVYKIFTIFDFVFFTINALQ